MADDAGGAGRYPDEWEIDALLRDGTPVQIRPIRSGDAPGLVAFHGRLSAETIYRRFFSPRPVLPDADVARFTTVDYRRRMALVAAVNDEIAGVARYDAVDGSGDGDEAEVAFVVEDRHQGRGLGSLLLEHLAAAARERGLRWFVADTLAENRSMLGVFRDAGFQAERTYDRGTVHLRFPIDQTPAAVEAMAERERRASVQSMSALLRPRSIAVVGASRQAGTVGHGILRNLLAGDFQGPVYPVNPTAVSVGGVRAYARIDDIPGPVDLAVVAVPAAEVAEVIDRCGDKGVRSVVVVSAGFAETGPEGEAAEHDVLRRARHHGMRLVGPNGMGVINTSADVSMNATVGRRRPVPGRVSLLSESGPLGLAVLLRAEELGLGVSSFVSVGNKADVSGNDLLEYWEADTGTDVILLYLESFGNPRKFARIARRVARTKPIVAVKSGRTDGAGHRDDTVDALFRQTGVIRVDTLGELFDVTLVLAHQPVPAGRRLAVVADAHGPLALAVDACAAAGLMHAELSPATLAVLAPLRAPGEADHAVGGAVQLAPGATAVQVGQALEAVAADDGVDAVLVIFTPPLPGRPEDVAAAVAAVASGGSKPIVATFLAGRSSPGLVAGTEGDLHPVPVFPFPEPAVRALGRVAGFGEWRRRPDVRPDKPVGFDAAAVRGAVTAALAASPGGVTLDQAATALVLGPAGIKVAGGPVGAGAGVELDIEVVHDPLFGPVLSFGIGGLATDLLGDRAVRILPMTGADAAEVIRSVRAAPLLFGYAGAPRVDEAALVDLLVRVGTLAGEMPELRTLGLRPVTALPEGITVGAATLDLGPAPAGPGPLLRRLR